MTDFYPKLERLRPLLRRLRVWEPVLYALVCAVGTLHVAARFYGSSRLQTLYSDYWAAPELWHHGARAFGPWSAPLDDVFIHFDFARSAAQGHPFEWVPGNGYSSGSTSLLYPFVLAAGYAVGFQGLDLMLWAAIVACVSVFGLLLGLRRAFERLPVWTTYLLPLALLGIGALSWSLFSGMEIAFFLLLWLGAFLGWNGLLEQARSEPWAALVKRAAWLGAVGAALVATRPEAAVLVAIFALSGARALKGHGLKVALAGLVLIAAPGALVVAGSALANFLLTGETAAAGAIAKLELYHPFLTATEKLERWWFYFTYQILRLTQEHLESIPIIGWLVWLYALAALFFEETRRAAACLWACALGWTMTVALNGQVRWQNERYSMPALTWVLTAAALGTGVVLVRGLHKPRDPRVIALAALATVALPLFVWQAEPNFRFQAWYFGRGARNIYDQHVTLGRVLRQSPEHEATVLLGDAGAIPYVSEGHALDVIGLGGYKQLPFARATRAHVGSAIELIEHLAPAERPSLLAIYPSWWDELPLWFGSRLFEIPARGNVICGAPSVVVYRASWEALRGSDRPFRMPAGANVTAEFDWADVTSEARAHYERHPGLAGRVALKVLPDPRDPTRDVFDAGRNSPEGTRESFVLEGIVPGRRLELVFRAAPVARRVVPLRVDGAPVGELELPRTDGWVEVHVAVPPVERRRIVVELGPSGERVLYHAWAVQGP
jgi:hypothetical protein